MIRSAASKVMWGQRARNPALWVLAVLVAGMVGMLAANPAHAADFLVNSMEDAGDNNPGNGTCATAPFPVGTEPNCTLRAAIQEANVNGVSDTIAFDSFLSGTVTLTLGPLQIANDTPANDLTIEGSGANKITVSGFNASPVFLISTDAGATINGLTISNGRTNSIGGGILNRGALELTNSTVSENTTIGGFGGGIYNDSGTLTLTNSSVSENTANPHCELGSGCIGGAAGGIANASGTTALFDSTVSGNTARGGVGGGGIANQDGELQLTNSTVSGNTAATDGGGILNYVDKDVTTMELTNSTVSGNTATGGSGGGIFSFGEGTLTLTSSIVARNSAPQGTDAVGTFTSRGYNLIGDTTGATGFVASDLKNVNPLLGPLQNNGGPTLTHALLAGSPAVNAIPNETNGCGTEITTDQRGVNRPREGKCEIGAFEGDDLTAPKITTIAPTGKKVSPKVNVAATFSEAMNEATVEAPATFTLKKKGSAKALSAAVTYDLTTKKATLNPTNKLRSGATYIATVTTAAKDSAGNALDQNSNTAGDQPKSWRFTVR